MKSLPWRISINTPLFVGIGFGIGGIVQCLLFLFLNASLYIITMGVVGAIGGAFLAYRSTPRRSAILAALSYGLGLLLGGSISVVSLTLFLEKGTDPALPFLYFYFLFILGFCIAGATSAALIRPRLVPVATSTICFLVGSGVGGAAIGVLFGSPMSRACIAGTGLLITEVVSGAISGRALELSEATISE